MNKLYTRYYEESLSQSDSQQLDPHCFALTARKFRWNYQRFFRAIAKDAVILDLGCGIGQFLFYLNQAGYQRIIGIDITPEMIQRAKTMQPVLDFRHVPDSEAFLRNHPAHFDVIVLNDVLEHLEREALLPMMHALLGALKPDGRLIVKTINAAYPLGNATRYQDLTHRTSYHEKSLIQLLRHCGFAQVTCFQEEIGIYNPLFAVKKVVVLGVRLLLKLLVYFSEGGWPNIISLNIICTARRSRHD
ncbi:MAG: class I SAM-dependent methyltransferase [Desulfatitalea sp.]